MPSVSTVTPDAPALLVQLSDSHLFAEADGTLLGQDTKRKPKEADAVHIYRTASNVFMHQPDEKAQLNVFLGEWLSHCLALGHEFEAVR